MTYRKRVKRLLELLQGDDEPLSLLFDIVSENEQLRTRTGTQYQRIVKLTHELAKARAETQKRKSQLMRIRDLQREEDIELPSAVWKILNEDDKVYLTDWGRNKISTIKYFRQYSGYGLKKSKETIDRLDAGVYVCLNDHMRSVDIPAAVNDLTTKANCNVIRSETLQPT